jgi:hypothetical protein
MPGAPPPSRVPPPNKPAAVGPPPKTSSLSSSTSATSSSAPVGPPSKRTGQPSVTTPPRERKEAKSAAPVEFAMPHEFADRFFFMSLAELPAPPAHQNTEKKHIAGNHDRIYPVFPQRGSSLAAPSNTSSTTVHRDHAPTRSPVPVAAPARPPPRPTRRPVMMPKKTAPDTNSTPPSVPSRPTVPARPSTAPKSSHKPAKTEQLAALRAKRAAMVAKGMPESAIAIMDETISKVESS